MSGSKPGYSPRRAGEVVGVEVRADGERPVTITCHGHAHSYEIAWRDTADGPVITDLRVTSPEAVPITADSLRRINTDRLARTAAMYDTADTADVARALRQRIDAATGTSEGHDWIEEFRFTDGVVDAMARHAPPGATPPKPRARRTGRPPLSPEFLAQVAAWAREARWQGHSVYPYVAERAANALGREVSDETVKVWVRRCKQAGLLDSDELRQPRKPRTDQESDR
ncbi:hypothetical protein [Mycobacterium sp. HNNTM2301]|uniref:hypothetical protein n=1 Tax=Mycobacterium hainanense TaxID=3289775 RepID=UPI0035A62E7E